MSIKDDFLDIPSIPKLISNTLAVELWRKGVREWNNWISKNPEVEIDFSNIDFSEINPGVISFEGYIFPEGGVTFSNSTFNESDIIFRNSYFKGPVYFEDMNLQKCEIDFEGASFDSDASFLETTFQESVLSFKRTDFRGQLVSFERMRCISTSVFFYNTQFNCIDTIFSDVQFSGDIILFAGSQFECETVDFAGSLFKDSALFINTTFNAQDVSFSNVQFEGEDTDFTEAKFNSNTSFTGSVFKGVVRFFETKFHNKSYDFSKCIFEQHFDFSRIEDIKDAREITFRHAMFESSFDLSNIKLNCVIDLTGTKLTNQLSIAGLECNIQRTRFLPSKNKEDSDRLRRLKDICTTNNDHLAALRFHASEMRSRRWHHSTGSPSIPSTIAASLLDIAYDWSSVYGQSIIRPFLWLLLLISLFAVKYSELIQKTHTLPELVNLMLFSIGNSLPFIHLSKLAREAKIEEIFVNTPPNLYDWLILQGSLSFIFIFLIGLGLRNRFRI